MNDSNKSINQLLHTKLINYTIHILHSINTFASQRNISFARWNNLSFSSLLARRGRNFLISDGHLSHLTLNISATKVLYNTSNATTISLSQTQLVKTMLDKVLPKRYYFYFKNNTKSTTLQLQSGGSFIKI